MRLLHKSVVFIIIALTIAPFAFAGDTSGSFVTPNVHPFTPTQLTILDADSNCGGGALGLWDSGSPAQDNYTTHFLNITFNYTVADDTNADDQWVMLCVGTDYSRVDDISNTTILTAGEGDGTASLAIHDACDVFNGFNLSDDLYLANANYSNDYGPLDRTITIDSTTLLVTSPTENTSVNYNAVPNEPLMFWVVTQVFDNRSNNNVSDVRFYNITILNQAPYWSSVGDNATGFNIIGQALNFVPTTLETHNQTPSFDWTDVVNTEDGSGIDKCPADTINFTVVLGNDSAFTSTQVTFTNSSQGAAGGVPESSFNWSDGVTFDWLNWNGTETQDGGWSNASYWVRINATDGLQAGNSLEYEQEFMLTDDLPDLLSMTMDLNHSGSEYSVTHNQSPAVYWGGITERDGDTVEVFVVAGTGTSGSTVSDIIPEQSENARTTGFANNYTSNFFLTRVNFSNEGVDEGNGQWGNETVNILLRVNDSASGILSLNGNATASFQLVNYLPNVTSVEFSDASVNSYVQCNDRNGTAANCQLDAIASQNVSLAIRINATDADGDCNDEEYGALNHATNNVSAYVLFCLNNTNNQDCTDGIANFTFLLTNVTRIRGSENDHPDYTGVAGLENGVDTNTTCEFTFNTNITGQDGSTPPFWLKSGAYMFHLNITDQANLVIDGDLSNSTLSKYGGVWFYNAVTSVNFTDVVVPGDSAGANVLGTFNDGDTQYVMTNAGNNILDINWTATNFTKAEALKNWTLKADEGTEGDNDFVVDDDPIQGTDSSDSNNLSQVVITNQFNDNQAGGRLVHDTGLELCIADDCDSAQSQATYNESLPLYFHIRPPTGLASGTYSGTLTYTLTSCSRSGCIYPTY